MFTSTYALFIASSSRSIQLGRYREGWQGLRCVSSQRCSGLSLWYLWLHFGEWIKNLANTKQNKKINLTLSPGSFLFIVISNGIKTNIITQFSVVLKFFKKMPGHFTSMRSNVNNIYKDEQLKIFPQKTNVIKKIKTIQSFKARFYKGPIYLAHLSYFNLL